MPRVEPSEAKFRAPSDSAKLTQAIFLAASGVHGVEAIGRPRSTSNRSKSSVFPLETSVLQAQISRARCEVETLRILKSDNVQKDLTIRELQRKLRLLENHGSPSSMPLRFQGSGRMNHTTLNYALNSSNIPSDVDLPTQIGALPVVSQPETTTVIIAPSCLPQTTSALAPTDISGDSSFVTTDISAGAEFSREGTYLSGLLSDRARAVPQPVSKEEAQADEIVLLRTEIASLRQKDLTSFSQCLSLRKVVADLEVREASMANEVIPINQIFVDA